MDIQESKPSARELLDSSEFSMEEGGQRLLAPCLTFTLYVDETERTLIRDWYDRALTVLGDRFTHYVAEDMTREAKITPRTLGMVPTWLKKPRDRRYFIELLGGALPGIDPASLELQLLWIEPRSEAVAQRKRNNWRFLFKEGRPPVGVAQLSVLRLTLPLAHDLAKPEAFVRWALGFGLVREGSFVSGECACSLVIDEGYGSPVVDRRVASLCLRYPGLDWFKSSHSSYLQIWKPEADDILSLVKRAAWITFVNHRSLEFLGGLPKLREAFADAPEIKVHELERGVAIQAGEGPQLGDRSRGDFIPLYQKVARVLRPIRAELLKYPYQDEWVDDWLNSFDREPAP